MDAALAVSPAAAAQMQATRKPTIGQRKPQAKKGGLGAKKTGGGLGAQKVKKDFAEIEREAELADLGRQKAAQDEVEALKNREENEAKAAASMRLAYQDLSLEQKKAEEKIRTIDPKKANQVERLGMGVAKKGGVSHSAITEISTIDQEEPSNSRSSSNHFSMKKSSFEDDFEFVGGSGSSSRFDSEDSWQRSSSNNNSWEKEFQVLKTTTKIVESNDQWLNSFDDQPPKRSSGMKRPESLSTSNSSASNWDSKKYESAKAISSDMLFGNQQNVSQNLVEKLVIFGFKMR